jgi:hypothetical protein
MMLDQVRTRSGSRRQGRTALWAPAAVGRTTVLIASGVLVWFVGWYQLAGKASSDEQTSSLNVAILGVLLAGGGQLCWVLDGRRTVGRRRRGLLKDSDGVESVSPAAEVSRTPAEPWLAGGDRYYHRPDCALASGRELQRATRGEHENAGRSACGVCAP